MNRRKSLSAIATALAAGLFGVALPQAVFDSAHVEIDPETQAPVSSINPVLGVRLSDLPNEPTPRDRVRVRGQLYRISDVQPDGVAGALIILKKV